MPAPVNSRDTKWADGLRGIASFLVVTAHISRSLAPHLLAPTMGEHESPVIMQLPFLRCLVMGRPSVAAFAILSGFVNALKPIKQTRAGQIDACLAGVAKSAYRRTGRFIIPAVVATTLSWLMCQFGAYRLAKTVDSNWIRDTSPSPSRGFAAALVDLAHNLITTWTSGSNDYDKIQWTLTYLLRGSMLVYLALFATAYVQPKYRIMAYFMLMMYYWRLGDAVIGINIYAGLIMAEMTFYPEVQDYVQSRPISFGIASTLMIVTGLFAMSYPEDNPEWAIWSNFLTRVGDWILPARAEYARFFPGIGAQLVCYGVMFNATAKRLLSTSWPCFLGRVSFAIYLLHAPLLRTVLTWMLYGMNSRPPSPGNNAEGHPLPRPWIPRVSWPVAALAIPIFYVLLYRIASLWVAHVDPLCGRITNWIEEKVFREDSRQEKQILPA